MMMFWTYSEKRLLLSGGRSPQYEVSMEDCPPSSPSAYFQSGRRRRFWRRKWKKISLLHHLYGESSYSVIRDFSWDYRIHRSGGTGDGWRCCCYFCCSSGSHCGRFATFICRFHAFGLCHIDNKLRQSLIRLFSFLLRLHGWGSGCWVSCCRDAGYLYRFSLTLWL